MGVGVTGHPGPNALRRAMAKRLLPDDRTNIFYIFMGKKEALSDNLRWKDGGGGGGEIS